ncbi:MAG: hypothetical protein QNJ78_11575 [Gammaproteobacteria bacterium]|nr:hypothetical protein [Gammaproteobacteria bacterium]
MRVSILLATLGMSTSMSAIALGTGYPVAGTTPFQRPQGAPVIEWVSHDKSWYERALTGIQPPYPKSLYFLDNQGYWHTPFNQPGMTGPYDIRGWHD